MIWLQDNAAGLDPNKTSVILFGHSVGGWSPCHHLLQLEQRVAASVPLFVAVIMQSGFCDDIQDAWRAGQSKVLFNPLALDCRVRGVTLVACFSAPDVANISSLAGDILAYCSHWM